MPRCTPSAISEKHQKKRDIFHSSDATIYRKNDDYNYYDYNHHDNHAY